MHNNVFIHSVNKVKYLHLLHLLCEPRLYKMLTIFASLIGDFQLSKSFSQIDEIANLIMKLCQLVEYS